MNDYDEGVIHSYMNDYPDDYYPDDCCEEDYTLGLQDDTQPIQSKTLESVFVAKSAASEVEYYEQVAAYAARDVTRTLQIYSDSAKFSEEINQYGWRLEEGNEMENTPMAANNVLVQIRNMMGPDASGYVSKRAAAQFMMTEAARQLARYEIFPEEDPCEDLEVIYLERTFPQNPASAWYYAGIKVEGKYYMTGGKSDPQGYTWSQLVDWMAGFVKEVIIMTTGRRIVPVSNVSEKSTAEVVKTPTWEKQDVDKKEDVATQARWSERFNG